MTLKSIKDLEAEAKSLQEEYDKQAKADPEWVDTGEAWAITNDIAAIGASIRMAHPGQDMVEVHEGR